VRNSVLVDRSGLLHTPEEGAEEYEGSAE